MPKGVRGIWKTYERIQIEKVKIYKIYLTGSSKNARACFLESIIF